MCASVRACVQSANELAGREKLSVYMYIYMCGECVSVGYLRDSPITFPFSYISLQMVKKNSMM